MAAMAKSGSLRKNRALSTVGSRLAQSGAESSDNYAFPAASE
jgi:hypothetical protein